MEPEFSGPPLGSGVVVEPEAGAAMQAMYAYVKTLRDEVAATAPRGQGDGEGEEPAAGVMAPPSLEGTAAHADAFSLDGGGGDGGQALTDSAGAQLTHSTATVGAQTVAGGDPVGDTTPVRGAPPPPVFDASPVTRLPVLAVTTPARDGVADTAALCGAPLVPRRRTRARR